MDLVIVIGAGGHGLVIADMARRLWMEADILFLDDHLPKGSLGGGRLVGGTDSLGALLVEHRARKAGVVVAIGDNDRRRYKVEQVSLSLSRASVPFVTVVDPSAFVSQGAVLGEGSVVMPLAAVNTGARVGRHVILNTSSSVDHDCVLGDFVHISPGADLAGGVTLEDGVHVGTGASLIPGVRVGRGSVIGAGSVVVNDIPAGVVAYGVPPHVRRAVGGESSKQPQ